MKTFMIAYLDINNASIELISKFRNSLQNDIKYFNENVETQFGNSLLLVKIKKFNFF